MSLSCKWIKVAARTRGTKAAEKDTQRRQKTIERELVKAEKVAKKRGEPAPPSVGLVIPPPLEREPLGNFEKTNLSQPLSYRALSPDVAGELNFPIDREGCLSFFLLQLQWCLIQLCRAIFLDQAPEATFTPTAAGLRQDENIESGISDQLQLLIS